MYLLGRRYGSFGEAGSLSTSLNHEPSSSITLILVSPVVKGSLALSFIGLLHYPFRMGVLYSSSQWSQTVTIDRGQRQSDTQRRLLPGIIYNFTLLTLI